MVNSGVNFMDLNFESMPITEITSPPDSQHYRPVVLVVDDETVIADTLAIILSKNGFAPITAYDGKTALEISRVIPPDLLLSDVAMLGMTGVDLAIAITTAVTDCKVLLISGQSSITDILAEARNAGYEFPLLAKPLHPKELLNCIALCLNDNAALTFAKF